MLLGGISRPAGVAQLFRPVGAADRGRGAREAMWTWRLPSTPKVRCGGGGRGGSRHHGWCFGGGLRPSRGPGDLIGPEGVGSAAMHPYREVAPLVVDTNDLASLGGDQQAAGGGGEGDDAIPSLVEVGTRNHRRRPGGGRPISRPPTRSLRGGLAGCTGDGRCVMGKTPVDHRLPQPGRVALRGNESEHEHGRVDDDPLHYEAARPVSARPVAWLSALLGDLLQPLPRKS